MRRIGFATFMLAALACGSCSEASAPKNDACPPETGSVQVTVTTGTSLSFDWQPRCAVALLLVEEDASDQWVISGEDISENSTESANRIVPPITYGQVPSGIIEDTSPATLIAGQTYELVLWKVVPANSTAPCLQRFENACLLAVHPFQR